ncbi:hypothetical protein FB45DRAFT_931475 [Roridomyces roridus]|uniref:Uncharacterized protein n=1 Tax=Roridomyces roridus TaxID=1738132 RepID=A0AAD7FET2_9AGAR|nr:hypothetical protein FB45DRAFT_931475 [Roridomyces roridus]
MSTFPTAGGDPPTPDVEEQDPLTLAGSPEESSVTDHEGGGGGGGPDDAPDSHVQHPHSRMPSIDLLEHDMRELDLDSMIDRNPGGGVDQRAETAVPFFEPLGPEDLFDVFDLELAMVPGGKEATVDARYRSAESGSGRPTYKIQKKTKAHFLGKKNMSVEVSRSQGWDVSTAAPAANKGAKGYINVFSARDQPSRAVGLTATNNCVLTKTTLGAVVPISSACGSYDPMRVARQSSSHHFFSIKLNDGGGALSSTLPAKGKFHARPSVPLSAPPRAGEPQQYEGGGYFVLDSAARDRTDLVTTLYCTGYEQRPTPRVGDPVIAELRVRPSAGGPPTWARLFKERHAALHISRRGLEAALCGPHVNMCIRGDDGRPVDGMRAVLSRGQALEAVLAAVATALLAIEHEGGLAAKRWAWLAQQRVRPVAPPALGPSSPAMTDEDTNPGLTSPEGDGEGSAISDDSNGSPAALFERGPSGLFAGGGAEGYSPSIERASFIDRDGPEKGWAGADVEEERVPPLTMIQDAARGDKDTASIKSGIGAGIWARKGTHPPPPLVLAQQQPQQQHLGAGNWPLGKMQQNTNRQSVAVLGMGANGHGMAYGSQGEPLVAIAEPRSRAPTSPTTPTYTAVNGNGARSPPWAQPEQKAIGDDDYMFA